MYNIYTHIPGTEKDHDPQLKHLVVRPPIILHICLDIIYTCVDVRKY